MWHNRCMAVNISQFQEAFEQGDPEKIRHLLNECADIGTKNTPFLFHRFLFHPHTIVAFLKTAAWPAVGWIPNLKGHGEWRQEQHHKEAHAPTDLARCAVELVHAMVQHCPAELMDVPFVAQHSMWRHMRTVASNYCNPLLHHLVHQHCRPQWIGKILRYHGQWLADNCPNLTTPLWMGCLHWGGARTIEGLEIFIQQGWLDLADEDNVEVILKSAAQNGQLTLAEWVIDKTGAGPVPGVARKMLEHRRLNGTSNPTTLIQGWNSLTSRWGVPHGQELTSMWEGLVRFHITKKSMSGDTLKLLGLIREELQRQGLWKDEHFRVVMDKTIETLNPQMLDELLETAPRPSNEVLDEAIEKLAATVDLRPDVVREHKFIYLQSRLRQVRLDSVYRQAVAARDVPAPAPARPKF